MATMGADDHRNGMVAQSPMEYLMGFLFFGAVFIIFTLIQTTTSVNAVLSFLQSGMTVPSGLAGQQIGQFLQGNLDRNQTIAYAIAWGVQAYLIWFGFPSDAAHLLAHKKYTQFMSASLSEKAEFRAKLKNFIALILIGGDVVSDALYVLQGHTVIAGFNLLIIPNVTNMGVLLVAILLPVATCGVTIFFGPEAFRRLDGLISCLRGKK
jgi:hypothetical protein